MFANRNKTPDMAMNSTTTVGAGTSIHGNLESSGDIRIDGTLQGNIRTSAKVLIGHEGKVMGDIVAGQADVTGMVVGKVQVTGLLQLREKGSIQGDIHTAQLQVEPTATFNGNCHMGGSVVDLASSHSHSGSMAVNQ